MVPLLEKASPNAPIITVSSYGMYTTPLTKDVKVTKLWCCQPTHHGIKGPFSRVFPLILSRGLIWCLAYVP